MGLFTKTRDLAQASAAIDRWNILPPPPVAANTVGLEQIPGLLGGWMSRETARLVPAFARGLDLITGISAGFPLVELAGDGTELQPLGFTARPSYETGIPRVTTIRETVADLVCEGAAYWAITEALSNGYPLVVKRIDPVDVQRNTDGSWIVAGNDVPASRVIEFNSGTSGALRSGWYALNTAIALEGAANRYALSPLPSIALRSTGLDLTEEETKELLDAWEKARRTRGTAYLNSQVDTKEFGWNSSELQLVEARQHSAIEVARILNLDPVWVGSSPAGSSLTYQNKQDQNQQLLDGTILPLLRVIEQRLSMLIAGRSFRFDTVAFLRANLSERVNAITAYLAAGVISVEEARTMEPMLRKGDIPS